MLKADVKLGKVYEIKLSTGRKAWMRAIKCYIKGTQSRLLLQEVSKPSFTKWVTAARLIREVNLEPIHGLQPGWTPADVRAIALDHARHARMEMAQEVLNIIGERVEDQEWVFSLQVDPK